MLYRIGLVLFNFKLSVSTFVSHLLSDTKLSWISCGPRLTTLNNEDGSKRTGWTFGWALGDPSYKVIISYQIKLFELH